MDRLKLLLKGYALIIAGLVLAIGLFYVTSGSVEYWEAWLYCAVVFGPVFFVGAYIVWKDPALAERRMQAREKHAGQKQIIGSAWILFMVAFLIPGLDFRFGWSDVPVWLVIAADAVVLSGYLFVVLVLLENSYASRIIDVEKGQKVISTGPYAIVRHPMYLGTSIMYTATPIALGSYVALPFFILFSAVIVARLLDEEEILKRELPGYKEYCSKVKYRLIPLVW